MTNDNSLQVWMKNSKVVNEFEAALAKQDSLPQQLMLRTDVPGTYEFDMVSICFRELPSVPNTVLYYPPLDHTLIDA